MKITLKPDKKKILSYVVQVLVFIILVGVISIWQTRNLLDRGSQAPDFTVSSLNGNKYNLSKNKIVIVYFFAPWCRICKFTNSSIESLYSSYKDDQKVEIISIGLSWNSIDDLHQYKKKNKMVQDVYAGTKKISEEFKISAFPTIYIIENGKIRSKLVGYTTYPGLKIRLLLL